jgi:hypothetical protein
MDGLKECAAMDIPHALRDEFPQEISLVDIYRIESGEEPTIDEVLARLKKWRLKLKDEIAAILAKLENRM